MMLLHHIRRLQIPGRYIPKSQIWVTFGIFGGARKLFPQAKNGSFRGEAQELSFGHIEREKQFSASSIDHLHFLPRVESEETSVRTEGENAAVRSFGAGKDVRSPETGVIRSRRRERAVDEEHAVLTARSETANGLVTSGARRRPRHRLRQSLRRTNPRRRHLSAVDRREEKQRMNLRFWIGVRRNPASPYNRHTGKNTNSFAPYSSY